MIARPRPFDVVHVSSAHPWTDNRVHRRSAAAAADAGYRTALVAVRTADHGSDRDWSMPDPQTGVYVRRLPRRGRRLTRVVVGSVQAVTAAVGSRAHVVHLHDPELVWAVPLLRALGRRVVYDAHEDLPDQVRGKAYLPSLLRPAAVALAHVVVRLASTADTVVAATPAVARRFPQGRTVVVRNLPVVRAADELAPPPDVRPAAAVYLGSLSVSRGVDVLCDLAEPGVLPPGWRLVIAGPREPGAGGGRLDRLADAGAIDVRGVLPPDAARDLLLDARVGLLPLMPTPAYRNAIPTKLFEYMAAGLGIVATDIPFWRALLDGHDCVQWVPPGDAASIADAIRRYDDDPDLLVRHAADGRALVADRYRWECEARRLVDVYTAMFPATPFPQ
ncbi:MAG: glycosyltransferase [Williamsia herbipolensis]|nr:glycosyltransferase [Williamsia herbipolensis]